MFYTDDGQFILASFELLLHVMLSFALGYIFMLHLQNLIDYAFDA